MSEPAVLSVQRNGGDTKPWRMAKKAPAKPPKEAPKAKAESFVTTSCGPGNATTNLAFLIYARALLQYDIGGASAGGVVAIVLANIVAFFLVRSIARRLEV